MASKAAVVVGDSQRNPAVLRDNVDSLPVKQNASILIDQITNAHQRPLEAQNSARATQRPGADRGARPRRGTLLLYLGHPSSQGVKTRPRGRSLCPRLIERRVVRARDVAHARAAGER